MGYASVGSGWNLYKLAENYAYNGSASFDVTSIPGWNTLTGSNFIVAVISGRGNDYGEVGRTVWPILNPLSVNYSSETGTLSISGPGVSMGYSGGIFSSGRAVLDVYVYTGKVTNVFEN